MLKLNRRNIDINQFLTQGYENISIDCYFAKKVAGEGFDEYEKNYTNTIVSIRNIKDALSREITAERLVYKQYGLKELGALEILCDARYTEWFRKAVKIVIDNMEYEVYSDGVGNSPMIQARPFNMIRVTITKKGDRV